MNENKSKSSQMVLADLIIENSTELKAFNKEIIGLEFINVVECLRNKLKMGRKFIIEFKNKEGNLQFAIVEGPARAVFGLANA